MTTRSADGVWRSSERVTLTNLADMEGLSRREGAKDFTVAEMKRLNRWLKQHGLNVDKDKWSL